MNTVPVEVINCCVLPHMNAFDLLNFSVVSKCWYDISAKELEARKLKHYSGEVYQPELFLSPYVDYKRLILDNFIKGQYNKLFQPISCIDAVDKNRAFVAMKYPVYNTEKFRGTETYSEKKIYCCIYCCKKVGNPDKHILKKKHLKSVSEIISKNGLFSFDKLEYKKNYKKEKYNDKNGYIKYRDVEVKLTPKDVYDINHIYDFNLKQYLDIGEIHRKLVENNYKCIYTHNAIKYFTPEEIVNYKNKHYFTNTKKYGDRTKYIL